MVLSSGAATRHSSATFSVGCSPRIIIIEGAVQLLWLTAVLIVVRLGLNYATVIIIYLLIFFIFIIFSSCSGVTLSLQLTLAAWVLEGRDRLWRSASPLLHYDDGSFAVLAREHVGAHVINDTTIIVVVAM